MAAIAGAESTFRPGVVNDNPATRDLSYGLWQINMLGALGPARRKQFGLSSNDDLKDPLTNAKAAKAIFDSSGFGAWGAYTNGSYNKYLPAAQALNMSQQQTTTQPPGQQPTSTPLGRPDPFAPVQPAQLAQQQNQTVTTQGTINDMYKGATNTSTFQTTSGYGMRKHPIYGDMRMHNGVDIAPPGPGYYVGLKVPGKVTLKSNDARGYGNFVIITSQQTGMSYMFAHMATIDVNVGDEYTGQPIGEMGNTGGSTGIHLHYEVYQGGKGGPAVDPTPYMNLLTMGKVDGQVRSQTAQISSQQQSSSQASSVSSRTSYDPMSQNNGGGVVPVGVPGQSGGGGGGRALNMGGPSTQQMLNSYYKSQLMGFLYKQG